MIEKESNMEIEIENYNKGIDIQISGSPEHGYDTCASIFLKKERAIRVKDYLNSLPDLMTG